ncbi:MAG: uroporphyrinogen-III synthase [Sphingobium sp.]|nr:uroporphyrinogen-III synthase [Sphingobium sp.]
MSNTAPLMRPVLILRPEPGAEATEKRAQERGLTSLLYPLFAVRPLSWDAPDPANFDALMLTSANSLRHGGDAIALYHHLPVFAVGATTATAARDHGFSSVITAGPDAPAMLAAIGETPHRRLFHPGGKDFRPYDAGPFHITRRAVYHAAEAGDEAGLAPYLAQNPVLLIHSPRAGRRVAALIPAEQRERLSIITISPAALAAAGEGWRQALSASTPDDALMLDIARQICQI